MWFLFLIWFILYCRFYDAVKNYFSSAYYKFVAIICCKFDAFFPGFSKIFFIFNIHFPSKLPRFHSIKFFKLRIWITNSLKSRSLGTSREAWGVTKEIQKISIKKCYNYTSCFMIFVLFILWAFLRKTLLKSVVRRYWLARRYWLVNG